MTARQPVDDAGTARVLRVAGPLVEVENSGDAAVHDLVMLGVRGTFGEVVAIRGGTLIVQAYEYTGGLRPGDPAVAQGRPLSARLGPGLLGGVFDGLLRPLSTAPTWLAPGSYRHRDARRWRLRPTARLGDQVAAGAVLGTVAGPGQVEYRVLVPPAAGGRVETIVAEGDYPDEASVAVVGGTAVPLATHWPIRTARPYRQRLEHSELLTTGLRVLDLLFPVDRGGTACVPGGFGTGKTVLLQQIAKWCDADVIVYIGCGERGNEMAEIVAEISELSDPRTGGQLSDRTVIIANTSNMPMMAREASIYTGVTVAEYFRDMGYHVVVVADSTSRWAEALREFASRTGELPAEEGYPANLASALAAFYERAGAVRTLGGRLGSVAVLGAVSPPGGDLTEPVTVQTERFVRCRWTLDHELAYARHYPAVSWSGSFSRDAEPLGAVYAAKGDTGWAARRSRVIELLAESDRLAALSELVGAEALPPRERMMLFASRLLREGLLQQSALSDADVYSAPERTALLADAILAVVDRCLGVIAGGVTADAVEALDFGPLIRARELAGPDLAATVAQRRDAALGRLEQLL
ncbi:V-type ATP synthase subunit A [Nocardia australiensis]|uniref:V-type ATP synthase subunit A n=1 Tax=Nocardia australiensis TaxID=2887191 RepID=UPI001D14C30E|nr:V-type ATP synthase subunit A [Nocardia australiensis]